MSKKKKKYNFGSANNSQIKNYIETPAEALADNQINIAKALYEANSDPLFQTLQGAGGLLMNAGLNKAGGVGGLGDSFLGGINEIFANGGVVNGEEVEVEGEEVVELPSGKTEKVKGPSHENGGIDLFLPDGSEVFSKRIKIGGETMADRKMKREAQLEKLQKALERNPTDKISKETFNRGKSAIDKEEQSDMNIQMVISGIVGSDNDKAQFGLPNLKSITNALIPGFEGLAPVPDIPLNNQDPNDPNSPFFVGPPEAPTTEIPPIDLGEVLGDISASESGLNGIEIEDNNGSNVGFGDLLSIGGDLFSTFAPLVNTLKNRAGDTPNINAFKDFGKDAIEDVQAAQNLIAGQKSDALDDVNVSSRSARSRNRGTSRSANVQRATDLAIEQQANRVKSDIHNNFANQMMNLLLHEAQFENVQDQAVQSGEQARDLADRQDRDAFSTNLAKNITGIGQGLQETGKDVNAIRQNEIITNLLNQLSSYGLTIDNKGNISQ